jgi:hypothetical protein
LSHDLWAFVERCSHQVAKPSAPTFTAP